MQMDLFYHITPPMTGAALGHAVSHVEEDFEVPRVIGQEKAGEGGVALERVVILIVVHVLVAIYSYHVLRESCPCSGSMHPVGVDLSGN